MGKLKENDGNKNSATRFEIDLVAYYFDKAFSRMKSSDMELFEISTLLRKHSTSTNKSFHDKLNLILVQLSNSSLSTPQFIPWMNNLAYIQLDGTPNTEIEDVSKILKKLDVSAAEWNNWVFKNDLGVVTGITYCPETHECILECLYSNFNALKYYYHPKSSTRSPRVELMALDLYELIFLKHNLLI